MKNAAKNLYSYILVGVFIIMACGCVTKVTYNVSLKSVESPADAKTQFGETKIVSFMDEAAAITKYSFADDFIDITWFVDSCQFNFSLVNKSNHTIKINWDDISYVNYNGQTGRVMHTGVKYSEKNDSQPSTPVPRGASITDILLPTDNVSFSLYSNGWHEQPLIPCIFKKKEADAAASEYVGKTMTILLPIYIENVQNDYIFIFSIDSYDYPQKQKSEDITLFR